MLLSLMLQILQPNQPKKYQLPTQLNLLLPSTYLPSPPSSNLLLFPHLPMVISQLRTTVPMIVNSCLVVRIPKICAWFRVVERKNTEGQEVIQTLRILEIAS